MTIHTMRQAAKITIVRYLALSLFLAASLGGASPMRAQTGVWTESLLGKIRAAATMIPGTPPQSVHVLRFAQHEAPQSASLDGGSNELIRILTFSVYQIRFTDGWIIVDAGIDQSTLASRIPGATIPQENYELIQRALVGARSIVITHEHDDHVTGVIRTPAPRHHRPKDTVFNPSSGPDADRAPEQSFGSAHDAVGATSTSSLTTTCCTRWPLASC